MELCALVLLNPLYENEGSLTSLHLLLMEKRGGDNKTGGKEGKTIFLHIEILVIFFILQKHHPYTWQRKRIMSLPNIIPSVGFH